jgi:hypothetical protein
MKYLSHLLRHNRFIPVGEIICEAIDEIREFGILFVLFDFALIFAISLPTPYSIG